MNSISFKIIIKIISASFIWLKSRSRLINNDVDVKNLKTNNLSLNDVQLLLGKGNYDQKLILSPFKHNKSHIIIL